MPDIGKDRPPHCGDKEFGITTGPVSVNMQGVRQRKRQMVEPARFPRLADS